MLVEVNSNNRNNWSMCALVWCVYVCVGVMNVNVHVCVYVCVVSRSRGGEVCLLPIVEL